MFEDFANNPKNEWNIQLRFGNLRVSKVNDIAEKLITIATKKSIHSPNVWLFWCLYVRDYNISHSAKIDDRKQTARFNEIGEGYIFKGVECFNVFLISFLGKITSYSLKNIDWLVITTFNASSVINIEFNSLNFKRTYKYEIKVAWQNTNKSFWKWYSKLIMFFSWNFNCEKCNGFKSQVPSSVNFSLKVKIKWNEF